MRSVSEKDPETGQGRVGGNKLTHQADASLTYIVHAQYGSYENNTGSRAMTLEAGPDGGVSSGEGPVLVKGPSQGVQHGGSGTSQGGPLGSTTDTYGQDRSAPEVFKQNLALVTTPGHANQVESCDQRSDPTSSTSVRTGDKVLQEDTQQTEVRSSGR